MHTSYMFFLFFLFFLKILINESVILYYVTLNSGTHTCIYYVIEIKYIIKYLYNRSFIQKGVHF